jgi:DNA-binding transcriptional ArsR family regulator
MDQVVAIARALSDLGRVRIVHALAGRELCACQLVELLQLAPSTVSKHMAILRQAGLVAVRKDGRWSHYRRADAAAPDVVRDALRWLDRAIADDDPTARDDRQRLDAILDQPLEELCRIERS